MSTNNDDPRSLTLSFTASEEEGTSRHIYDFALHRVVGGEREDRIFESAGYDTDENAGWTVKFTGLNLGERYQAVGRRSLDALAQYMRKVGGRV